MVTYPRQNLLRESGQAFETLNRPVNEQMLHINNKAFLFYRANSMIAELLGMEETSGNQESVQVENSKKLALPALLNKIITDLSL